MVVVIGVSVSVVGIIVVGVAAARPGATMAIHGGMQISDGEVSTSVLESEILFLSQIFSQIMGHRGFSYSDINDMQGFWSFFVLSVPAHVC